MAILKRFAAPIALLAPSLLLIVGVVLAAVATAVLDHDILGRDAEGWPILYKTPALRYAVATFHLAVVLLLPVALAVSFLAIGRRLGVHTVWIVIGGVLVSTLGSVHLIEAAWTGIKGTSDLRIGIVNDPVIAGIRLATNLALYAVAYFHLRRRAA